jgi:hypothetical protein
MIANWNRKMAKMRDPVQQCKWHPSTAGVGIAMPFSERRTIHFVIAKGPLAG